MEVLTHFRIIYLSVATNTVDGLQILPSGRSGELRILTLSKPPNSYILKLKKCMFCPQCIHMFFIILRTYRNYLPLQHELVSFDKRHALRLLRGTD